jgi:L-fucose isomerase-like protein
MSVPEGRSLPRRERISPSIACLPIGRGWTEVTRGQFDGLLAGLPDGLRVCQGAPVFTEVAILDAVEGVRTSVPDAVLLPALHGGSARSLVLAAIKSRVPALLWCHDEKHSLASSCLAMEALRQLGHPCALIHGSDAHAGQELAAVAAAAAALRTLSEARIGQIGPVHPNLVSCQVNPLVLQKTFGCWVVPFALAELRRRIAGLDARRVSDAESELRARCAVSAGLEPLGRALSIHLVLEELSREYRLDAFAVDCWNEIVGDFGATPCLGFAYEGYRIACEGDLALAVTLLAGEAISGGPGYAGDLLSLDEKTGLAVSMHCGGCAALHSTAAPMAIVHQSPPGAVQAEGSVLSCRPVLPPGTATAVLLHGRDLDQVHLRGCEIVETRFTDQMRVQFRIKGDLPGFRAEAAGNHYVIFPGDWVTAWARLASWLGLRVH